MKRSLLLVSVAALSAGCWGYGRGHGYGDGPGPGYQGTPYVGSPCDGNASIDPCASAGLACTPLLSDGGYICQLPGELYDCEQSVGCASGLSCQGGFCLQACATSDDCYDPLTVCAPFNHSGNACVLNECQGQDGLDVWQACPAASPDGGDGTCIPLQANSAGGSGCQQGGNVPLGGACQFYRADGGPGFCAVGLICMVDASGANLGLCMPLCNGFGGGGPSCPADTSCVPTSLPLIPPTVSEVDWVSLSGACAQTCTPGAGGGTDGGADAGAPNGGAPDAGESDAGAPDAGAPQGGCPAPTSCINGSITSSADFVCLP